MGALESIPSAQIGYTQTYCKKAVYLLSIFFSRVGSAKDPSKNRVHMLCMVTEIKFFFDFLGA